MLSAQDVLGLSHSSAALGNHSPSILLTCPYHLSWRFCVSSTIVSFRLIICLIILLDILSIHDILHDWYSVSISSVANLLLSAVIHLHTSDLYNTVLFMIMLYVCLMCMCI
jgi:hypothetical protein